MIMTRRFEDHHQMSANIFFSLRQTCYADVTPLTAEFHDSGTNAGVGKWKP